MLYITSVDHMFNQQFCLYVLFYFILNFQNCFSKGAFYGYTQCDNFNVEEDCNREGCIWCNYSSPVCKEINSCYRDNVTEFCRISLTDRWFCNLTIVTIGLLILFNIYINNAIFKILQSIFNIYLTASIFLMIIMIPNLVLLNYSITYFYYYSFGNIGLLILVYCIHSFIN